MNIPENRLVHVIVRVRAVTSTDSHGSTVYDYGIAASRKNMNAWLEQSSGTEPLSDGRDPLVGSWSMLTNDTDVTGRDRVEWNALVFEVDGTPKPIYTIASTEVHHLESTLRIVSG